jgi:hypothetical protein
MRIFKTKEELMDIEIVIIRTIDIMEQLGIEINNANKPWTIERLNDEFLSGNDKAAYFVANFCENYIL